jgi:RNA polymerase sigma factor (sigma-70 family)
MGSPSHLKKNWVLTQEAFDRLLTNLDADRDTAAEKYEVIRLKLVKFFEWRGCLDCEDLADEAINRVARKITEGETIENLSGYFYGVARMLHLETLREQEKARAAFNELTPLTQETEDRESEIRLECFNKCLQSLSDEWRELIIQYYQSEKREKINNRRELSERLGVSLNVLRIRTHRIRGKLENCITDCSSNYRAG